MRKARALLASAVALLVVSSWYGCKPGILNPSSEKEFLVYYFTDDANPALPYDVVASLSGTSIAAEVPFGTDRTALVAAYVTTGEEVRVGGILQASSVTSNDFTNSVIYTVVAENGSTQDYLVSVTPGPSGAKSITSFNLAGVEAAVSGLNISLTVPYDTLLTALVATFATTGVEVTVAGAIQKSGVTPNDFSSPVTYAVEAADGTSWSYTVIVSLGPSNEKEIAAYSLNGVAGVIGSATIDVSLPSSTDLTALVATFTTTGSSVKVDGVAQESGVTANNFSSPVTYTVVAEDGSTREYVVSVTLTCAPDNYEPNDSFGGYSSLGTVAEGSSEQSWTATISPSGDSDFYRLYAEEGSSTCFPGFSQSYAFRVRLQPPQGASCQDYDLYLYNDGGSQLGMSKLSGCAEETITYTWDGQCGWNDSRYFRIEVRPYSGASSCSPYTLYADMWEQ
jgi:hypothetical protein